MNLKELKTKFIAAGILGFLAITSYTVNPQPLFNFTGNNGVILSDKTENLISFLNEADEKRALAGTDLKASLFEANDESSFTLNPIEGVSLLETKEGNIEVTVKTIKDDFNMFTIFITQSLTSRNFFDPFEIPVTEFKQTLNKYGETVYTTTIFHSELSNFVNCRLNCADVKLGFFIFKSKDSEIDYAGGRGPVVIKLNNF